MCQHVNMWTWYSTVVSTCEHDNHQHGTQLSLKLTWCRTSHRAHHTDTASSRSGNLCPAWSRVTCHHTVTCHVSHHLDTLPDTRHARGGHVKLVPSRTVLFPSEEQHSHSRVTKPYRTNLSTSLVTFWPAPRVLVWESSTEMARVRAGTMAQTRMVSVVFCLHHNCIMSSARASSVTDVHAVTWIKDEFNNLFL